MEPQPSRSRGVRVSGIHKLSRLAVLGLVLLATRADASPAPPAGLAAYIEGSGIRLDWTANSEPDSVSTYLIFRDVTPNASTLYDSVAHPTTTYLDTEAATGQVYYYRLKAVDVHGGESGFSDEVEAGHGLNQALYFSGDSSYVDLGIGTFDDLNDFTVEFWARVHSYQYMARFFDGGRFNPGCPSAAVMQFDDTGHLLFILLDEMCSGHAVLDADTLAHDTWTHIAAVYDQYGAGLRLYRDGHLLGTNPYDQGSFNGWLAYALHYFLGRSNFVGDAFYNGDLDEVRISSIARYDSDFIPPPEAEVDEFTAALYHFDELDGEIAYDSSGNRRHGTIYNCQRVAGVPGRSVINITPLRLDFCYVQLGDRLSKRLWVYNTGNDTLLVYDVYSDHPDFAPQESAFTVPPGQEHDLWVDFSPSAVGPRSGVLTIEWNAPLTPTIDIPLVGEGTLDPTHPCELRINCGGPEFTTQDGRLFQDDRILGSYIGGEVGWNDWPPRVDGTVDDPLYYSGRYGAFRYQLDVMDGLYVVRLHFCEKSDLVIGGVRPFEINVLGAGAVQFDVHEAVYRDYATSLSFLVSVSGTPVTIDFTPIPQPNPVGDVRPMLQALEVLPMVANDLPPSPPVNLSAEGRYNLIVLSWDVPAEADVNGWSVERAVSADGPWNELTTAPHQATRFMDRDMVRNLYYYRIRTIDWFGNFSDYSEVMSARPLRPADSSLPAFEITMTEEDLQFLYDNPFNEDYLPGTFRHGYTYYPLVGLRHRGQLSRIFPKRSWKVKFDEFVPGLEFWNQDRIDLNADWLDPSFIRNPICYAMYASERTVAPESFPIHLEVNTQFSGVHNWIEQVEPRFFRRRGVDDSGALYKAVIAEVPATLVRLPTYEDYTIAYEKKTRETEGYDDLIAFIDALNLTPDEDYVRVITSILDVDNLLDNHALIIATGDVDKYWQNYYLYHVPADSLWMFIHFDHDVALSDPLGIPIDINYGMGAYPVIDRTLSQPVFRLIYARKLMRVLSTVCTPAWVAEQVTDLNNLIATDALLDINKAYADERYLLSGQELVTYMDRRRTELLGQLASYVEISPLFITEFMARNESTIADSAGEYDDWIEIYNTSSAPISLEGMFMTNDLADPTKHELGGITVAPHRHVLLWADGQPEQGDDHLAFTLDEGRGQLALFGRLADGNPPLDAVLFAKQLADVSYGRFPDSSEVWQPFAVPTPGGFNDPGQSPLPLLFINEFMAANDTTIVDEMGEADDWLEIYNAEDSAVAVGGYFLTDDLASPTKWALPDTTVAPHGFLLIWADEDPWQGPLHATFKLAAGGEQIGLFGRLADGNVPIDTLTFGQQQQDVSYGRWPDGGEDWVPMNAPSPGEANLPPNAIEDDGAAERTPRTWSLACSAPNPFQHSTSIDYAVPRASHVELKIFDVSGRLVRTLVNESRNVGRYTVEWDGRNGNAAPVASGVYFCRLRGGKGIEISRKIVMLDSEHH